MTSYLEPLMGIWPKSTGMVPAWSSTKIVQMVLIRGKSRSRGQKKKVSKMQLSKILILVWNYKAQSFHIWYI